MYMYMLHDMYSHHTVLITSFFLQKVIVRSLTAVFTFLLRYFFKYNTTNISTLILLEAFSMTMRLATMLLSLLLAQRESLPTIF